MKKVYYYIDINIETMLILGWGICDEASLIGETNSPNIYRVYLTKGQYNKMVQKLEADD